MVMYINNLYLIEAFVLTLYIRRIGVIFVCTDTDCADQILSECDYRP